MSERLAKELAKLRQNQLRPYSRIFTIADCKKGFNGACRDAALNDLHFHDLRHTGTTRMVRSGQLSIAEVMKITGHTQIKTFLRYLNLDSIEIGKISHRLDAVA